MGIHYDFLQGFAPVQGEGTFDGVPFYFRARWNHWELFVGTHDYDETYLFDEGDYGEGEFDASWMPAEVAQKIIESGYDKWKARQETKE